MRLCWPNQRDVVDVSLRRESGPLARGRLDADHAPEGFNELVDVVGCLKDGVTLLLLPPAPRPRLRELVHVERVLDADLLHAPLQLLHVVHALRILEVSGETRHKDATTREETKNIYETKRTFWLLEEKAKKKEKEKKALVEYGRPLHFLAKHR